MTDAQITIRPAQLADSDALASLCAQLDYPTTPEETAARLRLLQANDAHIVFVAETAGGKVVGWLHAVVRMMLMLDPFVEIGGLVVTDTSRKKGVGGQLMAAAETWGKAQGCTSLRLRSNIKRGEAHRFYDDLGYERIKQQVIFYKTLE